ATVDRVLNARHRVREETALRVYDAAQSIGYHAFGLIKQRVFEDLPQYRLAFLLQKPMQPFYHSFVREIETAARALTTARIQTQIDFPSAATPAAIVEKSNGLVAGTERLDLF
ncbi:LacI family transcriptional regulator, partial [Rhizobium johnstonii]